MKNLFKNLMLVAVAAMAFAACSQDVNEVNKVEKKTVISGVLNIENDDTRSGFVDKNEAGNAYVSEWDGGEYIRLYFSGGSSKCVEIDAEGNFEVEYIGDYSGTTVTICSPDDSWNSVDNYTIPATQTPRANSVDPAAHILKSDATNIVNGSVDATMKHAVAYGKMTINIPDVKVAKVELTINSYTKYTLDGANVVDNVFWFAAAEFTVNELIVKAYGANDKVYQKTITNPTHPEKGPMTFSKGRVSTFSVSNLEEQVNDVTVVKAVAGSHGSNVGETLVTFTLSSEDTFGIAFKTGNDNFIAPGIWQGNSWSQPNYITYIYYNSASISSYLEFEVSYADGMYTIAPFSAYDWNAGCNRDFPGYTGAIDGLAGSSTTPVFASAYVEDYGAGYGDYYLIFEDATLGKLILNACGMTNEDWSIPANVYGFTTTSNGFYPGMYSTYNDTYLYGGSVEIAIVDGQYVFTFSNLTDGGNIVLESATYTGIPTGLVVPGAGGEEPEEPEPEVNVKEVEIDRLYAASYGSDYDLSFYIKNEDYSNILINVWAGTYNTSGTYSFAYNGDTSNGFANYSTHQYKGTPISSGELTVVVEGNTRTFDFVFIVGGETYHFNYTHEG